MIRQHYARYRYAVKVHRESNIAFEGKRAPALCLEHSLKAFQGFQHFDVLHLESLPKVSKGTLFKDLPMLKMENS